MVAGVPSSSPSSSLSPVRSIVAAFPRVAAAAAVVFPSRRGATRANKLDALWLLPECNPTGAGAIWKLAGGRSRWPPVIFTVEEEAVEEVLLGSGCETDAAEATS